MTPVRRLVLVSPPHVAFVPAETAGPSHPLTRRRFVAGSLAFAVAAPTVVGAQSSEETFVGAWTGRLTTGSRSFTLRFDVGLGPTVRMTSVEEGDSRMADEVTIRGDRIVAVFTGALARFEGRRVGPDRIEGEWRQTVYRLPLVLTRGDAATAAPATVEPLTAAALQRWREQAGSPALGAAWARRDLPETVLVSGRRAADRGTGVTPGDRWHLGSITKAMTATLIAASVDAGEVTWTDTVGARLPDLADGLEPAVRELSFLELLSHRAGLAANLPDEQLASFAHATTPSVEERRRYAALALRMPTVGRARETFSYSNNGYVVAAAMLEARSGRPWEDLIRERVFAPLGMSETGFGAPDARANPVGHRESRLPRWIRSERIPVRPEHDGLADNVVPMGPAGRVHATLSDALRFLGAHRDRATLLRASTWDVLHTPPYGGTYALGWERRRDGTLWHNGSNTLWYAEALVAPTVAAVAASNDGAIDLAMPAVGIALEAARRAGEQAAAVPRAAI